MRSYALAVVGLVFLLGLLALAGSVWAAGNTYTVNTTSYTNDGSYDPLDSGDCTLWGAVEAAGGGGIDTIAFDIPITDPNYGYNAAGVWTIVLASTLYAAGDDIVDGTTQATNYGSDTNPYGPEIEVSAENQPAGATMWSMGNSNNTIKGLAISHGHGYAIFISSGDNNTIVGNYIGPDVTGSVNVSSAYDGILLGNGAQETTIGGSTESERNLISVIAGCGIRIFAEETAGNVVEGNYIGTDRSGT